MKMPIGRNDVDEARHDQQAEIKEQLGERPRLTMRSTRRSDCVSQIAALSATVTKTGRAGSGAGYSGSGPCIAGIKGGLRPS